MSCPTLRVRPACPSSGRLSLASVTQMSWPRQSNEPAFDVREALHAILGVDLPQINGLGPSLAVKLVGARGTNLIAWPSAKHFTSWLGLAPHNKISGGRCCRRRR